MTDDLILQQVHDEWKQKGFPYYPKDKKWRDNIFNQLINFKRDTETTEHAENHYLNEYMPINTTCCVNAPRIRWRL